MLVRIEALKIRFLLDSPLLFGVREPYWVEEVNDFGVIVE